jgi:hypothetical protein
MTPEERAELLSVYTTERQDDHSALLLGFTMATAAFTYMIAAIVYVYNLYYNNRCASPHPTSPLCDKLPLIQFVAPVIPVAVVGYLALNTAAARMRSVHLQHLEAALRKPLPNDKQFCVPQFHTDAGVVWRPDSPWRRNRGAHAVFTFISIVVYGLINGGVLLFTWFVLAVGRPTGQKVLVRILYGIVEGIEMLGFLLPLRLKRFRYSPSQDAGPSDAPTEDPPTPHGRGISLFIWSMRPSSSSSRASSTKP